MYKILNKKKTGVSCKNAKTTLGSQIVGTEIFFISNYSPKFENNCSGHFDKKRHKVALSKVIQAKNIYKL